MAASRPVVSFLASTATTSAHEALADEVRTSPPAPIAVRNRTPEPLIQGCHAACDRL